jgi:iron(III) transport system substrate-binding protein
MIRRWMILGAVLLGGALALVLVPRGRAAKSVVVYTSVDAEFALPFFEKFTRETGIAVVPRTDDEATKTTGLAERLLAMKGRPDGDVFWNSELSFTQLLADEGALEGYDAPSAHDIPAAFRDPQFRWTGFGARARVLIYNTKSVKRADVPATLEGLSDPRWKGRVCIAKPLFGTTRSHFVSLAIELGEEKAFALFRAWRANGVTVVESNGDVRNRVAEGQFDLGLTDTDDALGAMERNKPVDFTVPDQTRDLRGAYTVPNTVAILKGAPHEEYARAFVEYLLRPDSEKWLAENGAKQIPVRAVDAKLAPGLQGITPLKYNVEKLSSNVRPLGEKIFRILSGDAE